MECDVIPLSQQEVDPLGTVEHCNELEVDNVVYSQSLNLNSDVINFDHTDEFPKNRKIINITSPASSTSPLIAHTTAVKDSSQNYRNVSASSLFKSPFFPLFRLKHDRFFFFVPLYRNNSKNCRI